MRSGMRTPLGGIALGLALLAGCRSAPHTVPDPNSPAAQEPARSLTGAQVADVQVALARTVEGRGEVQQAAGFYTEAVRKDPTRADAWARLAVLADKEGKFAESEEAHRRALDLQPNDADLHCNRGYSLYLQERWDEAEAALRRAVGLKPDHRRAHNNLGLVMARTGRAAEALVCFRNAGCSSTDAHTNLAYGLTLSGDLSGARAQYELALKQSPASDSIRKRMEQLDVLSAELDPTRRAAPVPPAGVSGPARPQAPVVQPVPAQPAGRIEPQR